MIDSIDKPGTGTTTARDITAIIGAIQEAWSRDDIDAVMSHVAADCVYTIHLNEGALPSVGEHIGHEAIRRALEGIHATIERIMLRPLPIKVEGNRAHHLMEYLIRHRASGESLSGHYRLEWTFENGLLKQLAEFHDREKFDAFLRYVGMPPQSG